LPWDTLQVTFPNHHPMPRTEKDAKNMNFVAFPLPEQSCSGPVFKGFRYYQPKDVGCVVIFDINGFLAGFQTIVKDESIPADKKSWAKNMKWILSETVNGTIYHFQTQYFIKPDIVCTIGRTPDEFRDNENMNVYLMYKDGYELIPRYESDLSASWKKEVCIPLMGTHYFANTYQDMPADEFEPIYLMYNFGQLNVIGNFFFGSPSCSKFEITGPLFSLLFHKPPTFLKYPYNFRSLHIFLNVFFFECNSI